MTKIVPLGSEEFFMLEFLDMKEKKIIFSNQDKFYNLHQILRLQAGNVFQESSKFSVLFELFYIHQE